MSAIFYIVGTPIGNLEDISFRAIKVLKEVDLILCENVSNTQKLLKHYEIENNTTNYFANSKLSKIDKIIDLLKEGKSLALVSDAGMPTISDPGSLLIQKIYEAKKKGLDIDIQIIPGPTALTSALALSGFTGREFIFYGFLPHKKGRETLFKEIGESKKISIFYESVHRLLKTLESLDNYLDENRYLIVAKELTKIHEEVIRGNIKEIKNFFLNNQDRVKGEFVIVIDSNIK